MFSTSGIDMKKEHSGGGWQEWWWVAGTVVRGRNGGVAAD